MMQEAEGQPQEHQAAQEGMPETAKPVRHNRSGGPRLAIILTLIIISIATALFRKSKQEQAREQLPVKTEPADPGRRIPLSPALIALRSWDFLPGSVGENLFQFLEKGAPDYERTVMVFLQIDFSADTLRGFSEGQRLELEDLAKVLTAFPDLQVEIGAHSDQNRDVLRSYALSRLEADVIKTYLIAQGAAPEQISTRAYGYEFPLTDNSSSEAKAQNRRVELHIRQLPDMQ